MRRSIYSLGVMVLAGITALGGTVTTAVAQDASDMSYMFDQISHGLREEWHRRRIENDRSRFDLDRYMQRNTPTLDEQRESFRLQQVLRALGDPPVTEIRSGKTLNDLIVDIQILQGRGIRAEGVALGSHVLRNINVSAADSSSEAGIFKKGRLSWPALLRDQAFDQERRAIVKLLPRAVSQLSGGQVDAGTLDGLDRAVSGLNKRLKEMAKEQGDHASWSPAEYIAAKEFVQRMEKAVNLLDQPNAAEVLVLARDLQADTAAELVAYMSTHGLRFAPAAPGDERAYLTTYRALADYDMRLQAKAGSQSQLRSTQRASEKQPVGSRRNYALASTSALRGELKGAR
jgi:hypothetical protein